MDKGTPFLQVVRGDTTPPSGSAEMFEIGDIREHLHEDSNRENLEVIGEGAPDGEANLVLDDDAIVPAGIQQQPDDDQENPNERAIDEGAGPPRKKSKPPIKQKEDVAKFIESYEARRQCASSSGAVIEKQIKRYQVKTGAKVFFKSYFPFKGTGGAVFKVGEDFRLPDDKVPETFLDYEKKIVKTIADSFTTVIRDVRFGTPSDPRPGPSSSVFSPEKNIPEALDLNQCIICKKVAVTEGVLEYDSAWIGCAHQKCTSWVHADCLGFPGVTPARVKTMPEYYCLEHRMQGRMKLGVLPTYTAGPSAPTAVVAQPTEAARPTRSSRSRKKGGKT